MENENSAKDQVQTHFKLDAFYSMRKGKLTYPSICIAKEVEDSDEVLPVVVDILAKGELPLIAIYQGKLIELKLIEKNLKSINQLLQFYRLAIFISDDVRHEISSIDEMLSLTDFDWS